jgi:hypothetical protein
MPSTNEKITDHRANRLVRVLIQSSRAQPAAQRICGVRLDADQEGDGGVQVQQGPDARQRGD